MKKIILYMGLLSILTSNDLTITSSIINKDNHPISNVNVFCGNIGTVSDGNGFFTIICNEDELINISHIGYEKIYIKAQDLNNSIQLNQNDIIINEIKVNGGINESNVDTRIKIFNSNEIILKNNNHLEDIIQNSPNLHFSGGTSRARYFQIRGIGELSQFAGEGAPHFYVGLIVDDINFSGIGGISLLSDVKQIEVFKGPQSTSFGPNAMAGTINIVTNNPTENKINASLTYADYNTKKIDLTFSKKINNKTSSSFSIIKHNTDGMIKNLYNNKNDTNSQNELLLKTKIYYRPKETTNMIMTYYYIDFDNNYNVWTPDNNGYISYSDYQGSDDQITRALSLKSNYLFKKLTLTSISSYSYNKLFYSYDGDWASEDYWLSEHGFDPLVEDYNYNFKDETNRIRKSYSQEFKFTFNKFITGLYSSFLKEKDYRDGYFFAGDGFVNSTFEIKNIALYVKSAKSINNKNKLNTSLRLDRYETNQKLSYNLLNDTYDPVDYGPYTYKDRDSNIGLNISLIHYYSSNSIFFASYSNGYKTSGINQSPNFSNNRYYKTEKSYNAELGYKFQNNIININITSFYIHRTNPQLRLFIQLDLNDPLSFDYATFNSSNSYSSGIEVDLSFEIKNYSIYSSFSFLNTHIGSFMFDQDNNGSLDSFGSRESAHSPSNQHTIGITYNSKINKNITYNIENNYTDNFWFDDQSIHKSKSYNIINSSIKYTKNSYSFILWCKNVNDTIYPTRGYTLSLEPGLIIRDYKAYGMRKSLGITFNYKI